MRFQTIVAACFATTALAVSNPHKRAPKRVFTPNTPETQSQSLTKRASPKYLTQKTKSKAKPWKSRCDR